MKKLIYFSSGETKNQDALEAMDEASASLKRQLEKAPQLYTQGELKNRFFRIRVVPEKPDNKE